MSYDSVRSSAAGASRGFLNLVVPSLFFRDAQVEPVHRSTGSDLEDRAGNPGYERPESPAVQYVEDNRVPEPININSGDPRTSFGSSRVLYNSKGQKYSAGSGSSYSVAA